MIFVKELIRWLLSENNSNLQIGLFDVWHFLYLFIVFGGTVLLALLVKGEQRREKTVRMMAYLAIGLYIADFFLMPLSDSYNRISIDKLPFHVCTLMSVMAAFVQFNKRLAKLKTPVVTLAIASSLMWMCYPGSALGGQPPFSYIIFQTFMFHGFLFCWGALNLAYGFVALDFRKIWKEFCGTLIILVWAAIGNALYDDQNWYFISYSIFPFLPDRVMPPVVVFCVFGTCFVVYCGYFAIRALAGQKNKVSA